MKAITTTMYACGSLMVAAAIMGAIDYTSARHKGTFDTLYKDEKPVALPEDTREIAAEDFSRKAIDGPLKENTTPTAKTEAVKITVAKVPKPVVKKKKKITFKEFSRAAIPEEIILPDSLVKK